MNSKNTKKVGIAPAIILINPKFPPNLGSVIRSASCWGIYQVWWTGDRLLSGGNKMPREARIKKFNDVEVINYDKPFDRFDLKSVVPIAVEFQDDAESIDNFIHPENAVYVFGPEDGSLDSKHKRFCHRFVVIPTKHGLNLTVAVGIVLYKRYQQFASVA